MLAALLTIAAAAEASATSSSTILGGCSICKRIDAMSAEQQALYFTILGAVMSLSLLVWVLWHGRGKLLPNIPCPREQLPFFGLLFSIQRHFKTMAWWKNGIMERAVEDDRRRRISKLMREGASEAEIAKVRPTEMIQWSMPFYSTFVELLSPRNIKCMLSDNFSNFEKGYLFSDVFDETLGKGIFTVDGDAWRSQRKVASHMFSFAKLNQYMFETFSDESVFVIDHLHKAAKSGCEIDFQQLMYEFTFDSICKIAFGKKVQTIGSKTMHPFGHSFDEIQSLCAKRSMTPFFVWKTLRFLNIGSERTFRNHLKVIDEFIYDIVKDRHQSLDEYEDSGDLLSLFLLDAKKRGEVLSDHHLRDLILNFMIAGRDTTAAALTWMFYSLSSHPDIEAKCVDEIRSILDPTTEPTAERIRSLHYVEATFMETVRVAPPVPVDLKLCIKDTTFPSGEFVPAGTYCIYTPFFTNNNPNFYANSTTLQSWADDCRVFNPSRWLVEDSETGETKVLSPPSHEFITFNVAQRLCLGKAMAVLEGKTLASKILESFHIQVRDGYKPLQRIAPVLAMLDGLPVTVTRRK